MATITTRLRAVTVDGDVLALALGHKTAEFGDEVALDAVYDRKRIEPLYVGGVDTAPMDEFSAEVLALFDLTPESFRDAAERASGTGLPHNFPVTIYTLLAEPVEDFLGQDEEAV